MTQLLLYVEHLLCIWVYSSFFAFAAASACVAAVKIIVWGFRIVFWIIAWTNLIKKIDDPINRFDVREKKNQIFFPFKWKIKEKT